MNKNYLSSAKRRKYQRQYYLKNKSRDRLKWKWWNIKSRCSNPKGSSYKYYGSRGIRVCDEWKNNYECFESWALQNGWRPGLCIHRINADGNYAPENCQFITPKEHAKLCNGGLRLLSFQGKTQCLTHWAKEVGVSRQVLDQRIKKSGWSVERALTEPLGTGKTGRKKGSFRICVSSSIYRDRGQKKLDKIIRGRKLAV